MKITSKYDWLGRIDGLPKMVIEAIALGKLDTTEVPGAKSNPEIMALAKEAGVADIYTSDEIAWCAVAHTAIALRAGKNVPFTGVARLRAASFGKFGKETGVPMLGDTLVFHRDGGYHVGLYIAEDKECYHVAGGNQGNQYSITRVKKIRLMAARRPEYSAGVPASVKRIYVSAEGVVSENEA